MTMVKQQIMQSIIKVSFPDLIGNPEMETGLSGQAGQ